MNNWPISTNFALNELPELESACWLYTHLYVSYCRMRDDS